MSDLCIRHLTREHRDAERALEALDVLLDDLCVHARWGAAEQEDFVWIRTALGRKLLHHICKEDEALFPALEAFLPKNVGPLEVLRGEHVDLRAMFKRMGDIAHTLAQPDGFEDHVIQFCTQGGAFLRLVRDHIYKEEQVLFPMVSRMLEHRRDEELLRRFEEIDMAAGSSHAASSRA